MIKYRPTTFLSLLLSYLLLGVIPSQGTIRNNNSYYWNQLSRNTITYTNNYYYYYDDDDDDDDERFRKAVAALNENFPSRARKEEIKAINDSNTNLPLSIIYLINRYMYSIEPRPSHFDLTEAKNLNGFNDIDSKLAKKITTISFRSIHYKDIILAENLENVTRLNVKGMISLRELREIAKKKWEKLTALNLDLSEIENIENIKNYVRSLLKLKLNLSTKSIELPESFEDNCPNEFTKLENQGWKLNPEKNGRKIVDLIKGFKNRTFAEKTLIKGTIEQLIEKGANVNAKSNGFTALHMAAFNGCMDIVILLIEKGADINEKNNHGDRPLHKAIHGGYLNIATHLIEIGADVNTKGIGESPLHLLSDKIFCSLSEEDRLAFAKFLIEKGADIEIQGTRGGTPLLHAIQGEKMKLVKFFVGKGADVDKKNNYGNSPLLKAILSNNLSMVNLLLENKAKINAQNHSGYSSLHILSGDIVGYPSDEDRQVFAEFLIKHGADIEIKDTSGGTPLHNAAKEGRVGLVKFFIREGAKVNAKNNDGYTPLQIARQRKYPEIFDFLRENKADEINDWGDRQVCIDIPTLFISNNRTTSSGWRYRRIIYFLLFRGVF